MNGQLIQENRRRIVAGSRVLRYAAKPRKVQLAGRHCIIQGVPLCSLLMIYLAGRLAQIQWRTLATTKLARVPLSTDPWTISGILNELARHLCHVDASGRTDSLARNATGYRIIPSRRHLPASVRRRI